MGDRSQFRFLNKKTKKMKISSIRSFSKVPIGQIHVKNVSSMNRGPRPEIIPEVIPAVEHVKIPEAVQEIETVDALLSKAQVKHEASITETVAEMTQTGAVVEEVVVEAEVLAAEAEVIAEVVTEAVEAEVVAEAAEAEVVAEAVEAEVVAEAVETEVVAEAVEAEVVAEAVEAE